jgi:acetylornithine deacetylase/succinyl-diaminopimelate desuccinylase-like protein
MLPGDTEEQAKATIEQALADAAVTVTITRAAIPSPESPPTPAVMAIYNRVVHSLWSGLTVMPSMDAGASDSKFTRSAGVPTYGATSIFIDLEDMRAHGRDERVKADRFAQGSEFAYRLMVAFSAAGAP